MARSSAFYFSGAWLEKNHAAWACAARASSHAMIQRTHGSQRNSSNRCRPFCLRCETHQTGIGRSVCVAPSGAVCDTETVGRKNEFLQRLVAHFEARGEYISAAELELDGARRE